VARAVARAGFAHVGPEFSTPAPAALRVDAGPPEPSSRLAVVAFRAIGLEQHGHLAGLLGGGGSVALSDRRRSRPESLRAEASSAAATDLCGRLAVGASAAGSATAGCGGAVA
jgi:hypothetical protein